ncbi:unnamed protein product [Cuscuta campestris]|uniref:NAC domain-containing protein n=1 Tax=Cuscuta campestris TaxID=132261 RepID=A0A484LCJ8_9ASTE|nr:unnamed protein product [Cuscuta campestris]
MGKTLLPPGFRFHPTDVELVLYYLKRKIMRKKFHFDAILELNIYKFSPWDLPDKSCLKSKDLEWYFFVPRERKYTCGARMNRAAERGFWKTTGRDRPVIHDEQTIGMVKTLVFHEGHPPKGKRTDWVIHEYRIVDLHTKERTLQDSYVLCKVFQKSGPGPRNGAQYGAPFKEEDWENDVEFSVHPFPSNMLSPLSEPTNQACSVVTGVVDPGCTSGQPLSEPSPTFCSLVTDELLTKNQTCSVFTSGMLGSTYIQSLVEPNLSSTRPCSSVLPPDADDLCCFFASFPENTDLLPDQNVQNPGLDVEMMPLRVDENDIFSELCNLDSFADLNGGRSNFHGSPPALVSPREDASFFELDDLAVPVHHTTQVAEAQQALVGETFCPQNSSFLYVQYFNDGGIVPGNQFISTESQLQRWLLEQHNQQVFSSTHSL